MIKAQNNPPDDERPLPAHISTEKYELKTEEWVTDQIKTPWAIEFVSMDSALVSERRGCFGGL